MVKHILFYLPLSSLRDISSWKTVSLLIAAMAFFISPDRTYAQETLQPGEAYATRFSGATVEDGTTIIDIDGVVGSIIDIRSPDEPPKGQYWRSAPQRKPVTAGEVGQLFGIAFDDASPPNLYLTATSAYGLHRNADNSDWMKGMWGSGGGPGSVWKLFAANDYTPRLFADIKLNGRVNTGAALGNIAYDRWSRQLYVSDLESGMIHRLDLADGKDLGYYDHGAKGRKSFNDAVTGKLKSLKTNAFSATSKARTRECHEGLFENSPTCWNFADFRRRVWGLVVRKDKITQEVRLYYSVWGGHGFGVKAWEKAGDDRRNAIWSVKIAPDGSFDATDVRREFLLPDFFVGKDELKRFGPSHPVSDIAFEKGGDQNIMLLAERGGARNLGLKNEDAFASPHEARVLRYELDSAGIWQFKGRYDVGFYDRNNHGQPYLHANSSGGVDFGYGYTEIGDINLNEPGNTVWMTGDALCSPAGRCFSTLTGEYTDASQVHGLQGTPGGSYGENLPDAATHPYPKTGAPYPAPGLEKSIMIDTDINVDAIGKPIKSRISRNDATRIGDVEVYAPSEDTADAATPGVSGHPSDVIPVSPSGPGYPSTPGYSPGGTTTPLGSSKWGGGVTPPVPPPGGSKWGGGKPKVKIDLIINKKLVGGSCLPGGKCKFKITVKNVGEKDYKGAISFYDKLPIGWTFDSHHGGLLVWICQPKGGNTFTCKFHPGVPLGAGNWFGPGDSASVTITVNVPANAKGPIAENCASIIDNPKVPQDKGAKANDKDCVKITLPGPQKTGSDLEMKKDIVGMIPGCQPNSVCKFEITITNKGPDPYVQAVVFEDAMPVGWQFSKQTGAEWQTCSINGRIIRCETTPTLLTTPPTVTLKVNETIKLGLELKTPPAKANSQKVWNCAKVFPHVTADDTTGGNDKSCILLDLPGDLSLKKKPLITIEKTKANNKKCGGAFSDYCDYHFLVRNMGKATFKGPISIIDNNIPGVTYHSHTPNPPIWNCKDIEGGQTGKIRCDYQNGINVTLPPDATKFLYPLTLTVKWPQWPPQLKFIPNCATAIWPQGTSAKHCISVPVAESGGTVTGSASWAVFTFDSSGTKVCTPPNCSFFEFTASLEKTDEAQAYDGPMSMSISLPSGSDFPNARITRAGKACSANGWSCQKTGRGFDCSNNSCKLQPGEQLSVRMDGKLAPHMKAPPRIEQTREACGVLEWRAPKGKGIDIEQLDGKRTATACFTTTILAKKEPTPDSGMPKPQKADLALQKWGQEECMADGVCLYKIRVTNQGPGIFEAPLTIIDEGVQGWELLGGFPSPPWRCTRIDSGFKCDGNTALAPGNSVELLLELKVPALSNAMPREVENCARIEWPVNGHGERSGDLDPGNDSACTMTFIKGLRGKMMPPAEPGPDEPGERDCPRGKRWDSIDRRCISIEGPQKTEPARCPAGQHWDGRRCVCKEGMYWERGSRRCVPHKAEPGLHPCPPGMHRPRSIGSCVCMPGHHRAGNQCIKCPRGHEWRDGRCIPPKARQPKLQRCPPGMHRRGGRGVCVCMPGHNRAGNQCIKCPPKHKWVPQRQKCERIVE